jgi:23S rRNA (cytosine1962-C5)-methyltransferase
MPVVEDFVPIIQKALNARNVFMDKEHVVALRLLNGFVEGIPNLVVDLYGKTVVIFDHASDTRISADLLLEIVRFYTRQLPWIQAFVVKRRNDPIVHNRNGVIIQGTSLDSKILENGIWYALDLLLNQDASFYLDTKNLRSWAVKNLDGKKILNTFAYTGSFGVAAKMGGAREVIQSDRNKRFLSLAKRSYQLNNLTGAQNEFVIRDFFPFVRQLKRESKLFDCVILDPPFFSATNLGRIDLVADHKKLINKVRPLVGHQGWLVCVNNALFISGNDYIDTLEELCRDGFLEIEELIEVPEDVIGFADIKWRHLPVDPAPFNYATKIAVLRVFRKDLRSA